ncbi:MAG: hypothetical protein ACRC1H_02845 [Caldilineaceae bacterium]
MIQPFQPGDLFLVQRLQRHATRLHVSQALLQHRSPFWSALTAVKPWDNAKTVTCVLRQNGHGIARAGFLQAQRRPNRPEADVLLLAPALDTRTGHPAIWEKLLAHYLNEAAQHQTQRIYADVPDQPLLETTFAHVGFRTYTRQTVWRLSPGEQEGWIPQTVPNSAALRAPTRTDEWELLRLYGRSTPKEVQVAEGALGEPAVKPPILEWAFGGDVQHLVLAEEGEVQGCLRTVHGARGTWMQAWAEIGRSGDGRWETLVATGLAAMPARRRRLPVYMAVKEYQGGLGAVLNDLGFAPFADHACMGRQMVQRVATTEAVRLPVLEAIPEGVAGFRPPDPVRPVRPQPKLARPLHRHIVLAPHAAGKPEQGTRTVRFLDSPLQG